MVLRVSPTLLLGSWTSCLSYILEMDPGDVTRPAADEDPARDPAVSRWLGALGMGLARVADPTAFTWPRPWIARVQPPDSGRRRFRGR